MKSKLTIGFSILLALIIISCQTSRKATSARIPVINIKMDESFNMGMRVDFKIDSAYIDADTMTLKVTYNKSNGTDIFELIGNKMYMKSKPMKLQLFVNHIKTGVATESKTTKTLRFNIAAIKPNMDTEDILLLTMPGYGGKVSYKLR